MKVTSPFEKKKDKKESIERSLSKQRKRKERRTRNRQNCLKYPIRNEKNEKKKEIEPLAKRSPE